MNNNTQTQLELNKYHLDGNLLYKEHKYKEAITMWLLALDHYKDNYLHKNIYSNRLTYPIDGRGTFLSKKNDGFQKKDDFYSLKK